MNRFVFSFCDLIVTILSFFITASSLNGCAIHTPLPGNIPIHCSLPTPPSHKVPEHITCQLITDYNIPTKLQKYIKSQFDHLDIRMIELNDFTSKESPKQVVEELMLMTVPDDIASSMRRIPWSEFRLDYWHSRQQVRYQMWVDGIACPSSYIEFTVWKNLKPTVKKFANIEARLYRVVSKGEPKALLSARQAFIQSKLWTKYGPDKPKPITVVRLCYMPAISGQIRAGQQITFRPVWYFSSNSCLIGDLIVAQDYYIDAITGQEFTQSVNF